MNYLKGIRRIAVSTGGGDAPGLNAVIRAATLTAINNGWEVLGIRRGYLGIVRDEVDGQPGLMRLTADAVRGITHLGGTMLGTTTRSVPFGLSAADGVVTDGTQCDQLLARFHHHEIDALIAIGGDGSLSAANQLAMRGFPLVGVPKTIDNDLEATDTTFGFQTAVEVATDAIGRLHPTAEANQRVMVVQVMGRHSGWIALESGMAGGADVILIPEIPFSAARILDKIRAREASGRRFSIIVAAEGAMTRSDGSTVGKLNAGQGTVADRLADELEEMTGKEVQTLTLGHIQRGGSPIPSDRNLALRFGAAATRAVAAGHFGTMVALQGNQVRAVPLAEAVATNKRVQPDSETVATARSLGVSFGD